MKQKIYEYNNKYYIQERLDFKAILPDRPCYFCDIYKVYNNKSCCDLNGAVINYWDICGPAIYLKELKEGL